MDKAGHHAAWHATDSLPKSEGTLNFSRTADACHPWGATRDVRAGLECLRPGRLRRPARGGIGPRPTRADPGRCTHLVEAPAAASLDTWRGGHDRPDA